VEWRARWLKITGAKLRRKCRSCPSPFVGVEAGKRYRKLGKGWMHGASKRRGWQAEGGDAAGGYGGFLPLCLCCGCGVLMLCCLVSADTHDDDSIHKSQPHHQTPMSGLLMMSENTVCFFVPLPKVQYILMKCMWL
jgi:hypothetical protein